MGPSKSMGAAEETVAGPERVREGIRREGASIGLFSGSHRPGGCAERRPSHPLPGEATGAGCCCRRPPPQPRRSGSATRGRIYAGAPPARRVGSGRDGAGRGAARRGGAGAAAAGAPGAARGGGVGAAERGVLGTRGAVGAVLLALGLLQS